MGQAIYGNVSVFPVPKNEPSKASNITAVAIYNFQACKRLAILFHISIFVNKKKDFRTESKGRTGLVIIHIYSK